MVPRKSYIYAVGGQFPSFLLALILISYQGKLWHRTKSYSYHLLQLAKLMSAANCDSQFSPIGLVLPLRLLQCFVVFSVLVRFGVSESS